LTVLEEAYSGRKNVKKISRQPMMSRMTARVCLSDRDFMGEKDAVHIGT
jgi:hypothetical protein